MHPEIPAADADAASVDPPSSPVGACYRFRLATALRAGSGALHGVDRQLLADVLDMTITRTWRTALHPNEGGGGQPFTPKVTLTDGRRSFLPEDLASTDEAPLRALATASANPFVQGAILDVLWTRFGVHTDARAAVDARISAATLVDIEEAWFEVTTEIIRAGLLAMQISDRVRLRNVVAPAVESTGFRATTASDPGTVVGVASDLTHALLVHRKATKEIGKHGERWGVTTLWAARDLRSRGDHHRAEDGLLVAAALFAGSGLGDAAREVCAERIEWLLERGEAEGGMMHAHLVQLAVDEATTAGLTELAAKAKAKLRGAVTGATAHMKGIGVDIRLPPELAKVIHQAALRTPDVAHAIRSLAAAPWLTSIPVESLNEAAKEEAEQAVFLHLVPSVQYRDGKIAALRSTSEEKLREAVARYASLYLAQAELAAEHFLNAAFPRFDAETLYRSLGRPSWLEARRIPWFVRASERFASQDLASCGAILLTQYEGVLRDLARAAGHHAVKYDAGITLDETLNSLLRESVVRDLLGEEHAWFVEFLLCRSDMGRNLRNELAHGNLDIGQLCPGPVFLLWLLLLRLALYDRGDDVDGEAADTQHDARTIENDGDGSAGD